MMTTNVTAPIANDIVHMAVTLLTAHAGNPNTALKAENIPQILRDVHEVVRALADRDAADGITLTATGQASTAPRIAPRQIEAKAAAPVAKAAAPAPVAPAPLPAPAAAAPAPVVAAPASQPAPAAGEVWPAASNDQREKFQRLIAKFNIPVDLNGRPIARRQLKDLISEDGLMVADPISGEYFKMLKRHLTVTYDLTHEELLMMFHLTEKELPRTGPIYSETKRLQAAQLGLGKANGLGRPGKGKEKQRAAG